MVSEWLSGRHWLHSRQPETSVFPEPPLVPRYPAKGHKPSAIAQEAQTIYLAGATEG